MQFKDGILKTGPFMAYFFKKFTWASTNLYLLFFHKKYNKVNLT